MGLDMYLYGNKYIWYNDNESRNKIIERFPEFEGLEPKEISFRLGYWRKANHIHAWIIKNCADGEDECQRIDLEPNKLKELLEVCKQVLEDHFKAEELLPTTTGFFFGGTDYNEYYFDDIKTTIKIIEKALKYKDSLDFHYQASW